MLCLLLLPFFLSFLGSVISCSIRAVSIECLFVSLCRSFLLLHRLSDALSSFSFPSSLVVCCCSLFRLSSCFHLLTATTAASMAPLLLPLLVLDSLLLFGKILLFGGCQPDFLFISQLAGCPWPVCRLSLFDGPHRLFGRRLSR